MYVGASTTFGTAHSFCTLKKMSEPSGYPALGWSINTVPLPVEAVYVAFGVITVSW